MSHFKPLVSAAPPYSLLSSRFHYVSSAETDIRKTFARVRRELAAADDARLVIRRSQAVAAALCRDA